MNNNYENIKLGLGGGSIASDAAGGGAAAYFANVVGKYRGNGTLWRFGRFGLVAAACKSYQCKA